MSDDDTGSRLPPPALPGSLGHVNENSGKPSGDEPEPAVGDLGGALISPDDPMPERIDPLAAALIMPDEPIEHHEPVTTTVEAPDEDEGVVTGMGMDAHMDAEDLVAGGDPYVMDLIQKVGNLAEALKVKGEAGLRSSADMDKFELTLRGYCVGYLAGRRVKEGETPEYETSEFEASE
jgi:hypothetical protein